MLGGAANHQLEDGNSKRVDVFQHYYFHLLAFSYLLFLLRKWPVTRFCRKWHVHRRLRCKVGDLVKDVLTLCLKHNLGQVKLPMNQACIVSKVHSLGKLNGNVINSLDVGARHVNGQVQIQTFDVVENVASIV